MYIFKILTDRITFRIRCKLNKHNLQPLKWIFLFRNASKLLVKKKKRFTMFEKFYYQNEVSNFKIITEKIIFVKYVHIINFQDLLNRHARFLFTLKPETE